MKPIFLLYFLIQINVFPQTVHYLREIGNFKSASDFSFHPTGFFYVIDDLRNEVIKIDTSGKFINSAGGYGWKVSNFDSPADIFSNTLEVYIADKNNNRIQIFDKDLNFLSEFRGSRENNFEESFAYPTCVGVSNIGDLYILDSDNARILKYDLSGNYLIEIGNTDAGLFALNNPGKFVITQDNRLVLIEDSFLKIFDQFGNGLTNFNLGFTPTNININRNLIAVNSGTKCQIVKIWQRG